jgi:hypothetical protein
MKAHLPPLTDAELDHLAAQVDQQLKELRAAPATVSRVLPLSPAGTALPDAPAQRQVIETATGQPFANFWQRYRHNLRDDLCQPGGQLHDQWEKYRAIESKAAVRVSYAWLAAMGIPTGSIAPVAVAASVFLLNVLVNVGVKTICEGAADEADAK